MKSFNGEILFMGAYEFRMVNQAYSKLHHIAL